MAKRMRETMHEPDFTQNIIFDDNLAARAAIQTSKFGLLTYYAEGQVETLALHHQMLKDALCSCRKAKGFQIFILLYQNVIHAMP